MRKLIWFLVSIALFGGISHGIYLNFVGLNIDGLLEKFSNVHFVAPGNNFGGAFFWLPSKSLKDAEELSFSAGNNDTISCKSQLRGLYYNNQRWHRIWPLDNDSLSSLAKMNNTYDDLTIEGWLFTACEDKPYGIFGQVKYNLWGTETYLIWWTKVILDSNYFSVPFMDSFQYFDNKTPLWYVFDNVWWVGFVWWVLTGHKELIKYLDSNNSINKSFTYSGNQIVSAKSNDWEFIGNLMANMWAGQDTVRWVWIKGTVGLSKSISNVERQAILGNLQKQTSLFNAPDITSATLINKVKQTANLICRWRENLTDSTLLSHEDSILCFNYDEYDPANALTIDLSDNNYQGKTIVARNADVVLINSMDENSPSLDLFVDKGNLYIENNPDEFMPFDWQWYLSRSNEVTQWVYIKWNLVINGLIIWGNPISQEEFQHKLFFHGKITSLNSPLEYSEWRWQQINDLLWPGYENWISLQKVFTWYCNPVSGSGSDSTSDCSKAEDSNALIPLIIIDSKYNSKLIN